MAQKLSERIKRELGRSVRVEGLPVADWVLIDADDVIVHLFRPGSAQLLQSREDVGVRGQRAGRRGRHLIAAAHHRRLSSSRT